MKEVTHNILVVDDEQALRKLLSRIIGLEGYNVLQAGSIKEARAVLSANKIPVVLCDVRLPDGNGIYFITEIKKQSPATEVILMTAYGEIEDGVQAMKNGAFDYIVKADDNGKIIPLISQAISKYKENEKPSYYQQPTGKGDGLAGILGEAPAILIAKQLAAKVAATDATVLLLGETGSGKEVFAQAIHKESRRSSKPFVALNCSAVPKDLLESELLGYKAGAFTNAAKDKKGMLELADGGTLFLDEIGEMAFDLQAKLLRVLETRSFIKLGDIQHTAVDVRIIAATNRNLDKEVEEGKFRSDLLYRLNGFTIELPPLRNRKKDIPLLTAFFITAFAGKNNHAVNRMNPDFADALQKHYWKGNIRELKNIVERAMILAGDGELTIEHLPLDFISNHAQAHTTDNFDLASIEKIHIKRALEHTGNNKTEAAKLLHIGLATLYRKIDEYKLSPKQ